ncbi:hypothetical protein ACHAWO_000727 [Cyclotella atomus]|jgi:hypothetical protein|uniref:Uncharacterized protein n=1 Tax=Cyclotella atomus TaxID=382360 RepID=A0ABD3PFU9_9STRA
MKTHGTAQGVAKVRLTQYIPKESTASTLNKLKKITAVGSIVLITYVDQKCLGDMDTMLYNAKAI